MYCSNGYASDADAALYRATRNNQTDYDVKCGEFPYRASNWTHSRRVVFKVEKPYGQMILHTFVVTTMEMEPYKVIQFYCGRGSMESKYKINAYMGTNVFNCVAAKSDEEFNEARDAMIKDLQDKYHVDKVFDYFYQDALSQADDVATLVDMSKNIQ